MRNPIDQAQNTYTTKTIKLQTEHIPTHIEKSVLMTHQFKFIYTVSAILTYSPAFHSNQKEPHKLFKDTKVHFN